MLVYEATRGLGAEKKFPSVSPSVFGGPLDVWRIAWRLKM